MVGFGQLLHEVEAHKQAMQQLKGGYQCTMDNVDFKVLMKQYLDQQLQQNP